MSYTKKAACMVLAGLLLMVTGCNEHAKMKEKMVEHWEESVAKQKIPLIQGYVELGDVDQAKPILDKCLESMPENATLHLLAGRIHFLEEENIKAAESFNYAVHLDPELDQAWYYLGSLEVLRGDYQMALQHYLIAKKLNPGNTEYRISVSDVLAAMDMTEEAEAILEKGLAHDSRNLELLLAMAQLKQQAGKVDEAVVVYEQAQMIHGAHPRIIEPCAYAYITLNKWSDAYSKLYRLLPLFESDQQRYDSTMRSLAMCAYQSGQFEVAMDYYDQLSVRYRDDADIWLNMAQAALGADASGRAVYCAKKSLKFSSSPEAFAVLGSGLYMEGDYQASIEAYYEIIDHEELAGFAWFMTGRCYQQMGQTVQANSAFKRAEELDPDSDLINIFLKRSIQSL
jgi:tetratricopeptide (TPR) repeat protein